MEGLAEEKKALEELLVSEKENLATEKENLSEQVPLYKDHSANLILPSTQFDMHSSENAGLVKFDILGLTALTVISKTIKMLDTKNIKLDIKEFEPIVISANNILVTTIFSNLIDNAIKYSSNNSNINISLLKKEKIHFIIEDEGIGISKEHLEKVQNRFYRVDESRNKKIKGFGLGLSIVKNSISLHDGSIKISSKKDFGTTIEVIL